MTFDRAGTGLLLGGLALVLAACGGQSPEPGMPTADAVADETLRIINTGDATAVEKFTCDQGQDTDKAEGMIQSLAGDHAKAKRVSAHPGADGVVAYDLAASYTSQNGYDDVDSITLTVRQRSDGSWCLADFDLK